MNDARIPEDEGNAIDRLIRQRFRACRTLELFPQPARQWPGFFEAPPVGPQLRMFAPRRADDRATTPD